MKYKVVQNDGKNAQSMRFSSIVFVKNFNYEITFKFT